jgi:hypothetical protein
MVNHPNMLTALLTEAVRASFHRSLSHVYGYSLEMQTVDCENYLWTSQDVDTARDVYLIAALLDGRFYSNMIS